MRRLPILALIVALLAIYGGAPAYAQEDAERGRFVRFLEGMLSTPDRTVTLNGFQGTFSSTVSVAELTVADREGVWMRAENLVATWNRTALFRRTLDIESLAADRIDILRRPLPGESEGGSFSSPVDIQVDGFRFPMIALLAPVAGVAANLSAEGSASVDAEAVAGRIAMTRLDAPGGSLSADLRLEPEQNALTAEIRYAEPSDGLLAGLLNLPGQPALQFDLDGAGPLSAWRAEARLAADGAEVLGGTVAITRVDTAYRYTALLNGTLDAILPGRYAGLLSGQSDLAFDVTRNDDGSILVQSATLRSQGADIAASGRLTADLFPQSADIRVQLGRAGPTGIPLLPGNVTVTRVDLTAGLDDGAAAPWRASFTAEGVRSDAGTAERLQITANGEATNFAVAAERATTFEFEGSARGVLPNDARLAEALRPTVQLTGSGRWANGQPVTLEPLDLVLAGATLSFNGTAAPDALTGTYAFSTTDLARLSGLAGRPLSGAAAINANGTISLGAAATDVQVNAAGTDIDLGIEALDPFLAGLTRVIGRVGRTGNTLRFTDLAIENEQLRATVSGTVTEPSLDLAVDLRVADLSRVTPRASGAARIAGTVKGSQAAPEVDLEATGSEVVLMGRPLTGARARFAGTLAGPETAGEATLSAELGGVPVQGTARLAAGDDGGRLLQDLVLSVGESRAAGDLRIAQDGRLTGDLEIRSPDVSVVAPLFLVEARGALQASVALSGDGGRQSARFSGTASDFAYETVSVASAEISGTAENLFTAPQIEGAFSVRDLRAGGVQVVTATGTARRVGQSTAFSVEAALADGEATLVGNLDPVQGGFGIGLEALRFRRPGVDLRLAGPTTVLVRDGTAEFSGASVLVNSGRATVSGRAGEQLALDVAFAGVPAALANSFSAELDAEGTISGTATVTGSAADPVASFDANWSGASVAATRNAGLGPLAIAAEGSFADGNVTLDSTISGGGLTLAVTGSLGTAPGAGLGLRVTGELPLALGNRTLENRGAVLRGALRVDVAVGGTLQDPQLSGSITSQGGGFVDPTTGITLRDLSLSASVSNDQITVERLTARSGDGTVSATGSIGIGNGFPVNLAITVRDARYVDGTLVAATFDADLTITGGLLQQPELAGTVRIAEANITVPEQLPRGSVALEVLHLYAPPAVEETLVKARLDQRRSGSAGGEPRGIRLAVTIDAPARIFVRGRGLDAELGGRVTLTGPVSNIAAAGAFDMRRGRFDILTQRITFDRGILTFVGDLDPLLDFSGTTSSNEITVTVTVSGRASDPDVDFSSDPELPGDEVLARLLFNRSVAELSPVQLARLAAAASQYTGGSGGGLLNRLRESTGLDDLDIVTDETGGLALQAGRYISENVYLGVQTGASAESTRVTIELDITQDVKARAAVSPDGNSSIGIFYEREY